MARLDSVLARFVHYKFSSSGEVHPQGSGELAIEILKKPAALNDEIKITLSVVAIKRNSPRIRASPP